MNRSDDKIDVYKLHKAEYEAKRTPAMIDAGAGKYLTVDGQGEPGGELFQSMVAKLYQMAWTVKMSQKAAGHDFKVAGLEGIWWGDEGEDSFASQPPSTWNWKLMIRVPDFVTPRDVKSAAAELKKKGKTEATDNVHLEQLKEGRCVQALHLGPYSNEKETIAVMKEFAEAHGAAVHGRHHEIYLSDPHRVPPERLKTILRLPVA